MDMGREVREMESESKVKALLCGLLMAVLLYVAVVCIFVL
jgi:hypothetical protein